MVRNQIIALLCMMSSTVGIMADNYNFGSWNVDVNTNTGVLTAAWGKTCVLNNSVAQWGNENSTMSIAQCRGFKVEESDVTTPWWSAARRLSVSATAPDDSPVKLILTFAADAPQMMVQLQLSGQQASEGVDFMMPVHSTSGVKLGGLDYRQLSVPYDNDAWVRYSLTEFGNDAADSFEFGAVFDALSRRGLVAGSVDHGLWKSVVRYTTVAPDILEKFDLMCGAASSVSRDVRRHGLVTGDTVASPRFLLASTNDWRDGLEWLADACSAIAPNQTKGGAKPFGWNSWGDLQTKINYENATEVADFINTSLRPEFQSADSTVYIDLDAFWDFGFNAEQHRRFTARCRANGQRPAIYYCPFTDWGKNPDAVVNEAPQYKMGDLYLRHNGEKIEFDGAPALDPTHPGTRARIERQLNEFKDWGYEYVKIDFMAHGAYEADSHFDPTVMTGTQAFNSGMAFIDSVADGKLWLNLSIAPLFPANYAQSRRIGCDAWSDIGSTEYTLNALTYGWWLDHMYHYNDADHIVFKNVSEGENRARLLSSAITGVFFLGDDMSATGDSLTLECIKRFAKNQSINDMARRTKSFRPVRPGNGTAASDIFEGRDGSTVWVAMFNYGQHDKSMTVALGELGLESTGVTDVTELWSGDKIDFSNGLLRRTIGPKDAIVFQIETKK